MELRREEALGRRPREAALQRRSPWPFGRPHGELPVAPRPRHPHQPDLQGDRPHDRDEQHRLPHDRGGAADRHHPRHREDREDAPRRPAAGEDHPASDLPEGTGLERPVPHPQRRRLEGDPAPRGQPERPLVRLQRQVHGRGGESRQRVLLGRGPPVRRGLRAVAERAPALPQLGACADARRVSLANPSAALSGGRLHRRRGRRAPAPVRTVPVPQRPPAREAQRHQGLGRVLRPRDDRRLDHRGLGGRREGRSREALRGAQGSEPRLGRHRLPAAELAHDLGRTPHRLQGEDDHVHVRHEQLGEGRACA